MSRGVKSLDWLAEEDQLAKALDAAVANGGLGIWNLKRRMNKVGWHLSLRDVGDGKRVDVVWFWAQDWRRTGIERGEHGEEERLALVAARKGLTAPVPE